PRADRRIVAESLQYEGRLEFALPAAKRKRARDWTDYIFGVAAALGKAGIGVRGANLLVDGKVPIAAGLSSSAALEVSCGLALCALAGVDLAREELAKICQRAENEYVGARCGIMDQFIACTGKKGHAVLLDCRSLEYKYAPLPEGVALVLCNTMVKHSIAGGEYNRRREECEEGVRRLARKFPGIRALRDVTAEQLKRYAGELPAVVARRCRHVVTENGRVVRAAQALAAGDLGEFGELMYASHASLRDDYEVSSPELDLMVELARQQPGVIGARMTGGGFGGCTVNLVQASEAAEFRARVAAAYQQKTGVRPDIYITQAADGARAVA
ncbi:MAG TPA: galactokinase, partial [Terriglobales bacterium]|nr:galactokinase [Terriglobales bacterium]